MFIWSSQKSIEERPGTEKRYWKDVLWSPRYFAASCAGAPLGIIKRYVQQQRLRFKGLPYIPALKEGLYGSTGSNQFYGTVGRKNLC
jgi:Transposase IS200 like